MKDTDYAYCVARVRAAESKMLTTEDFNSLKNLASFSEAVRFLKEKRWISSDKYSLRDIVTTEKENLWKLLSESVPDKSELNILCTLNDFFNIKAVVKCILTDTSPENYIMKPTTVNLDSLKENLFKRDFYAVFKDKADVAEKAYNSSAQSESGLIAEIITDRATIDYMASYAERLRDKITAEACSFIADTSNIKIALRCAYANQNEYFINEAIGQCIKISRDKLITTAVKGKKELYEYLYTTVYKDGVKLSETSFSYFENWCDEKLVEITAESKYSAFSFSPVCFYYYKKMMEIKNINIILGRLSAFEETEEGQVEADV